MSISTLKSRLGGQVQGMGNQVQRFGNQTQSFTNQAQDLQPQTLESRTTQPQTIQPQTLQPSTGEATHTAAQSAIPIYSPDPSKQEPPEQVNVVDTEVQDDSAVSSYDSETNNTASLHNLQTINTVSFDVLETNSAITNSNYIALTTNAIDIINENLKNQPLSHQLFDIIKAPTGGTTVFTIPDISGDDIQKELIGVILDYDTPRAYWETSEPVEGTPPTCYSQDIRVSADGKYCIGCPYNEFGSKIGGSNAKACKEFINLYLLRPDSILPLIVRIPVTSKHHFQKYLTRLIGKMIPICGIVTKISLEKATSKGGQPYAKFNFEAVEQLSPKEASYAKAYGQKFTDMLSVDYDVQEVYDVGDIQDIPDGLSANKIS